VKSTVIGILSLLVALGASSQNIKIMDAVASQRDFLLRPAPGKFRYCHAVQTYSDTKSKFRIYKFDSVAKVTAIIDLDAYGDYKLLSYALTQNFTVVAAHSRAQEKLGLWFINSETDAVAGPILYTIPSKPSPDFDVIVTPDQDVCYVLVTMPSKKNTGVPFRIVAFAASSRIAWDISAKSEAGGLIRSVVCDDKILIQAYDKGVYTGTTTINQSDGAIVQYDPPDRCLPSGGDRMPGTQFMLGSKKVIWVDEVATDQGSYLIGEEYSNDAATGAVAGGVILALTGVHGANFTTVRFLDVVIQPLPTDGTTKLPTPWIVPLEPRSFTSQGIASGPGLAYYAISNGRNRYLGTDKAGARFLDGDQVTRISFTNGEKSVFGKFNYKGRVPAIIHVSSTGLLVKDVDEQTYVIHFYRIPFN
jgi:hypothetical protein